MSHILGKSATAKQPSAIGALSFQTSERGRVIPLVYGTAKVSPNLLDYDDFASTVPPSPGRGGKKGGGKSQQATSQQTTYSASVIWGLCQGPIRRIGTIWENNSTLNQGSITLAVHTGDDGQPVDSFWETNHPEKAMSYSGTAYLVTPNLPLGTSASLPTTSVEVVSNFDGGGPGFSDGWPADILRDFLTNQRYGAGFPGAHLSSLTLFDEYTHTLLIALSPALEEQREALQYVDDVTKICNSAIVWSGEQLKIIPYGDSAVASSALWHLVFSGGDLTGGASFSLTMTDSTVIGSPATATLATTQNGKLNDYVNNFVAEIVTIAPPFGITIGAVSSQVGTPTDAASVTITLIQQPSDNTTTITGSHTGVPGITLEITSTPSPAGGGYSPNVTPLYDLTLDDFIVDETSVGQAGSISIGGAALRSGAGMVAGGEDPVSIERMAPADMVNNIKVEWIDRGNNYNVEVTEAWDQSSMDSYGLRNSTPFKGRAICDPSVASICAQLALNRALLYRNTYTFRLGWRYCLLEPMDLVSLTEPGLGLDRQMVRVTSVEENAEGTLTINAEDFVLGYSSSPLYPRQPGQGYKPNWNAPPTHLNRPVIFEPPSSVAAHQVWMGVSGSSDVGSIAVHISSDGASYAPFGTLSGQATTGHLTASLLVGSGTDTVHTLSLDLSESRGALNSVSSSDAASLVTLSWVGDADGTNGELIAYQTATLTGVNTYDLTTLYRGAKGSDVLSHSNSSAFLFIDADATVGKFPYDPTWVGQTVYFKFLASNNVGGGTQSLADVPAWPYTLTGGASAAQPYPIFIEFYSGDGLTTASQIMNVFVAPLAIGFPANFGAIAGAVTEGRASVAAATPEDFAIQKALAATPNTSFNIGNMHFNNGAVTPSFTTTGGTAQSLAPGDSIRIVGTSTPDATLAGVVAVLAGSH